MKDLIKFKRSFLALMLCFALTVSTLSGCSSSNKSDSDSILGYLSEGEALFEAGDYSGAIGAYKDAVLMDERRHSALL